MRGAMVASRLEGGREFSPLWVLKQDRVSVLTAKGRRASPPGDPRPQEGPPPNPCCAFFHGSSILEAPTTPRTVVALPVG